MPKNFSLPDRASIGLRAFPLLLLAAFILSLFPQMAADPLMIAPMAVLTAGLLLSGRLSDINLRDPVLLYLILLWLGWQWGAIFSPAPFISDVTLLVLGLLPVTYLCAQRQNITPLLHGVILAAVALSCAAIGEVALKAPAEIIRARLFFSDSNILGALIAFTIPLALSFCFSATDRKAKAALYLAVLLLIGGLVATQSRSAFLGVMVGVLPVLLLNRRSLNKSFLKAAAPLALLLVGGLIVTGFGDRLLLALNIDKDLLGRFSLWKAAAHMAFIDPVHGLGLGTFSLNYPPYETLQDNSSGFWVHMDPLQWAVETGWATPFFFYALAAYVFYRCLTSALTPLQTGAAASLLTIFLVSHTGYVLHAAPVLILAGILLSAFAPPLSPDMPRRRYALTAALLVVAVCSLWNFSRAAPTLYLWTQATHSFRQGDADAYLRNIQRCMDAGNPLFPGCNLEAARMMIMSAVSPPPEALEWLGRAETANPLSPEPPTLRAVYMLKTDPAAADKIEAPLQDALKKDPGHWPARRLLVQTMIGEGRYKDAYDTLQEAGNRRVAKRVAAEYEELEKQIRAKLKK